MSTDKHMTGIAPDEIRDAVAAGILPQSQASALLDFVANRRAMPTEPDEEALRFIRSFNDIFVTIAIGLVLFALASLLNEVSSAAAAMGIAIASWALAEYFTRRRRMAFPSIMLLGTFTVGVFFAALALAGLDMGDGLKPLPVGIGGIAAAGAASLHWLRFRVPITVAAGMGALVVLALALSGLDKATPAVMLIGGLITLAVAMFFDIVDTRRITRKADIAFWLHMLAAPLIVHGLFTIMGILSDNLSAAHAGIVLAFYLVFGLFALVIDRRALLVSSLIYVLYAASTLIASSGFSDYSSGLTALVIGVFLLLLSAGWSVLRKSVLRFLPETVRKLVPAAG